MCWFLQDRQLWCSLPEPQLSACWGHTAALSSSDAFLMPFCSLLPSHVDKPGCTEV